MLDPDGVPIADGPTDEWEPDVVWNGSAFVVAWTAPVANGADIRVERLTPDLQTIGPDDLNFAAASFAQTGVSLAVEGTTTVAIYTDARDQDDGDGTNIYMNRLTANGEMLDDGFAIATGSVNQVAGGVAGSPTGVLATRTAMEGGASGVEPVVHARRFIGGAPAGPVLDIAADGDAPRVAWGPNGYLVAWKELQQDVLADVVGRYVSGQAVPSTPFAITTGAKSEDLTAVAATDDGYFVTASAKGVTGGAGLDVLGIPRRRPVRLDDPPIHLATPREPRTSPPSSTPAPGSSPSGPEEDAATGWDIRIGRMGSDGHLEDGAGLPVAETAGDERLPSVGWNGSAALVTWWMTPIPWADARSSDEPGRHAGGCCERPGTGTCNSAPRSRAMAAASRWPGSPARPDAERDPAADVRPGRERRRPVDGPRLPCLRCAGGDRTARRWLSRRVVDDGSRRPG